MYMYTYMLVYIHVGEGGEKERVLRQWCRRLRWEYAVRNNPSVRSGMSGGSRLNPELIRKLNSIPGWQWKLRRARGKYAERRKVTRRLGKKTRL